MPLCISHILNKGNHPRLRYCEDNVVLQCWIKGARYPRLCHDVYHAASHGGWVDKRRKEICQRIADVKGFKDFDELKIHLLTAERMHDPINSLKLQALEADFKRQIKEIS